jgi:chromosome segregation ATPase
MISSRFLTGIAAAAVAASVALPAFAETANVSAGAKVNAVVPTGISVKMRPAASTTMRAGKEGDAMQRGMQFGADAIEKRVQSLQNLAARISSMTRLSSDQKASLSASINAEVDALNSLKASIGSDTSTTSLKADVQSITKSMRVYMLVIPQAQIAAAADRLLATAAQFEALSVKLSARIDAAQTAGKDVTALNTALSDMNAKAADAKVQANAAISATVNLKPDNGDASVQASNTAALKDARTKLEAARADLKAAFADAQTIAKGVRGTGTSTPDVHAEVNANANSTVQ